MPYDHIAWLILRIVFAWMYLYPLITLLQDWPTLVNTTALLFKWQPNFFAVLSVLTMIVGAVSILFGIYAQIGGSLLCVFTLGGAVIHYRLAAIAKTSVANPHQHELAKLAVAGHITSAQKNFVLAAVAFFFALLGSGPMSITMNLWGN